MILLWSFRIRFSTRTCGLQEKSGQNFYRIFSISYLTVSEFKINHSFQSVLEKSIFLSRQWQEYCHHSISVNSNWKFQRHCRKQPARMYSFQKALKRPAPLTVTLYWLPINETVLSQNLHILFKYWSFSW